MTTWRKNILPDQPDLNRRATPHTHTPNKPTKPPVSIRAPKVIPGDVGNQSGVSFVHPSDQVGTLTIETGLDIAQWGYNLNTQVYTTYGGEVIQILSVYIDDLQMGGTVATYSQMEAVYSYFARYMQIATQGKNPNPQPGVSAYNLQPITMHYPARKWVFEIMPIAAPGFYYGQDVISPIWRLTAHIVDDSANTNPTLTSIKEQISNAVVAQGLDTFRKLNGEISPDMKDPNTMPFMVFTGNKQQADQSASNYADYYNGITASYAGASGSSLPGSGPITSAVTDIQKGAKSIVKKAEGVGQSGANAAGQAAAQALKGFPTLGGSGSPDQIEYQRVFRNVFNSLWEHYRNRGCDEVMKYNIPDLYPSGSAIDKAATLAAINSFTKPPYSCPFSPL